MENANEILHNHNLKRTSCREGIITLLLNEKIALSEQEIKDRLGSTYDRTTFYRSFKTLIDADILHRIVVDAQQVKYAINHDSYENKNGHLHFYCNTCEKVVCIDQPIPKHANLPGGFTCRETEIIIKGNCCNCNAETRKTK